MQILRTTPTARHIETNQARAMHFGAAFGLVAAATLLNLLAWPAGSDQDGHYFALMLAVLVSALYGGKGPGLLATALAGLSSSYFTLLPQFSISVGSPHATERLLVFLGEGALLSLVAGVLRGEITVATSGWRRYGAIPLAVGAATAVKLIFPEIGQDLPFAFDYAAVCVCAITGGIVPGIVATALLAGLTKYLFMPPLYSLSVAGKTDVIRVGLFVGEGLLLTVLGSSYSKLKRLAAYFSAQARAYLAAALSRGQDIEAMHAISRDTIWEWDLDTGEIIRTPSWQDTLSVALPEREDFVCWIDRIHPDDREMTINRLRRALEEGREELHYSYRLLGPDGKFLPVSDHAFVVRGADWKPVRVIGRSAELSTVLG
jgi:K+-sensing histidine kinase KdpD